MLFPQQGDAAIGAWPPSLREFAKPSERALRAGADLSIMAIGKRRATMPDEWLEHMVQDIRAKQAALDNQKKAANTFFRDRGLDEPFTVEEDEATTARVRPDEYYGKGFATAAGDVMARRKQAITHEEVLRALTAGGFDFDALGWKEENRARTVAMSLAKNTAIFHRLPNGMFGLKKWYGDAIDKKKARKEEAAGKDIAADDIATTEGEIAD